MLAAIDIGSNSIRMLVAELKAGKVIREEVRINSTRLGTNIEAEGRLSPAAVDRTVAALAEFKRILEARGDIKQVFVVGTSALRDADSAREFLDTVEKKLGWKPEVLSARKEAEMAAAGALHVRTAPGEKCCLIDIGGGSTELVLCHLNKPVWSFSAPVGAVRCSEGSLSPTEIEEKLNPGLEALSEAGPLRAFGVGGTVTSLTAVQQKLEPYDPAQVDGFELTKEMVDILLFRLSVRSAGERKHLPGMQPERADIIVAGTMTLWVIMTRLGLPSITVSERDLLDGVILAYAKQ